MKHTYVRLAFVFTPTVLISDVEFTRGINLSLCQVETEQYRKYHREQDVRQWQSPVHNFISTCPPLLQSKGWPGWSKYGI